MEYFDFHVHAFTDSLAQRAVGALSETSGIAPATDGTVKCLRTLMEKNNISKAMLLPVATKPSQQTTINNWASEVMGGGIYCCGSVHPDAEDAVRDIRRIKSLGLSGVKFHSEYQYFLPDEERMFPLYEAIAKEGLIAVFHGGWDPFGDSDIRATPERFAVAARKFPELKIVAAHLGAMNLWDDVEKHLAGKFDNVFFDVSVIARYLTDYSQVERIIKAHGADKILFGSDCPWDTPENEIAMINSLNLSEAEKELIFFRNAERLLESAKNNAQ